MLPRFEVEELEGEVEATQYLKTENGLEQVKVMEPAGWMVYMPNGHSIRVRTEKMLKFLGFHRRPGMAMMAEGEQTEDQEDTPVSLKRLVAQKTQPVRRGQARSEE